MPRKGMAAMWGAIRWIRKMKFEVIFDLQGSDRSRALCLFSGASRRVGVRPAFIYTDRPAIDDRGAPVFERLNALLQGAGLPPAEPRPRLWVDKAVENEVDQWLNEQAIQQPIVLLHAGSSARWLSKRWPEARFAELAKQLTQQGLTAIWLGGEDERELNQRLAKTVGIDATAAFSIGALSVLASRAQFAVVNDSGPMHVISCAGIPVFAFFGPTDWRRSHAIGQEKHVLRHPVDCSPCHLNECPAERGHVCLESISVAQVIARLREEKLVT
jgi:ADP-heptose:LPS heptosyltransferase